MYACSFLSEAVVTSTPDLKVGASLKALDIPEVLAEPKADSGEKKPAQKVEPAADHLALDCSPARSGGPYQKDAFSSGCDDAVREFGCQG
jgi:hypothetical protein